MALLLSSACSQIDSAIYLPGVGKMSTSQPLVDSEVIFITLSTLKCLFD